MIGLLEKVAGFGGTGGVDQNIAATVGLLYRFEQGLAAIERRKIAGDDGRLESVGRRNFVGCHTQIVFRFGGEHRLRAGPGISFGDGPADAAAATGDHGDFAVQFA